MPRMIDISRNPGFFQLLRTKVLQLIRRVLGTQQLKQEMSTLQLLTAQSIALAARANYANIRQLHEASFSVFSQFGEDGILDFICSKISLSRPKVLELGCGDFGECNSRFLAEYRSASAVLVDARNDLIEKVKQLEVYWKNHILPIQTWITPDSLAGIQTFAQKFMGGIDIVSLDVDSNDYWIAQSLDFSNVKIVVVEYNPFFGSKRAVSILRDDNHDRRKAHFTWDYYGASLMAFKTMFEKRGLSFIGSNLQGTNAFFVRDSAVPSLGLDDTQPLDFYVNCPTRDSRLKQGGLSYRTFSERINDLHGLQVVDVISGEIIHIGPDTH